MRLSCTTFVEAGRAAAFLASRRVSFPLSSFFFFFTYFPAIWFSKYYTTLDDSNGTACRNRSTSRSNCLSYDYINYLIII